MLIQTTLKYGGTVVSKLQEILSNQEEPCHMYEADIFRLKLLDSKEAYEEFYYEGEDLQYVVPKSLIDRYKAVEAEYQAIQKELYKLRDEQDKKRYG